TGRRPARPATGSTRQSAACAHTSHTRRRSGGLQGTHAPRVLGALAVNVTTDSAVTSTLSSVVTGVRLPTSDTQPRVDRKSAKIADGRWRRGPAWGVRSAPCSNSAGNASSPGAGQPPGDPVWPRPAHRIAQSPPRRVPLADPVSPGPAANPATGGA